VWRNLLILLAFVCFGPSTLELDGSTLSDVSVISRHISNVFKEKELDRKSNLQKMQIAGADRPVTFYSLDVVISRRLPGQIASRHQFRIWVNGVLRDHLREGAIRSTSAASARPASPTWNRPSSSLGAPSTPTG
jgi:hypothetical protein